MTTPAIRAFENEHHFLSNFEPCVVEFDGHEYPSTEHAYHAAKTFDRTARMKIRGAGTPASAKKMGRAAVLREDWEQVKIGVMEALLRQKFAQPAFKEKLLATGDAELVEGNWWHDTFWGVCTGGRKCSCPSSGNGANHLGQLLMKVRAELRS